MYRNQADQWCSEFPPVRGVETIVDEHQSVVAVTSYGGTTGGHAAMYVEQVSQGDAIVHKVHLTAGLGGSQQAESTASGSSAPSGANEIYINVEPKEVNQESRDRATTLRYQSWTISNADLAALDAAIEKYRNKVAQGRYVYRLAGGVAGWLSTLPGKRGVNCADFCIKILRDAGIANIDDKLVNTPKRVAGG